MTNQCQHGQLARVCLTCEHEATIAALTAERDALTDVLQRNGFVRCDVAACNCGSWHPRHGLPERWAEVKDALSDAGHPLSNDNGNLVIKALAGLVAERDRLREELERARVDAERYRWLRSQLLDDPEIWIAVDSASVPSRWGLGGDDPDGCDAAIDAAMERQNCDE